MPASAANTDTRSKRLAKSSRFCGKKDEIGAATQPTHAVVPAKVGYCRPSWREFSAPRCPIELSRIKALARQNRLIARNALHWYREMSDKGARLLRPVLTQAEIEPLFLTQDNGATRSDIPCPETLRRYLNLLIEAELVIRVGKRRDLGVLLPSLERRCCNDGLPPEGFFERYKQARKERRNERDRAQYAEKRRAHKPTHVGLADHEECPEWLSWALEATFVIDPSLSSTRGLADASPPPPQPSTSERSDAPSARSTQGPYPARRDRTGEGGKEGRPVVDDRPFCELAPLETKILKIQQPAQPANSRPSIVPDLAPVPAQAPEPFAADAAVGAPVKLSQAAQAFVDHLLANKPVHLRPDDQEPTGPEAAASVALRVKKPAGQREAGISTLSVNYINKSYGLRLSAMKVRSAKISAMSLVDAVHWAVQKHEKEPFASLEGAVMRSAMKREAGTWGSLKKARRGRR